MLYAKGMDGVTGETLQRGADARRPRPRERECTEVHDRSPSVEGNEADALRCKCLPSFGFDTLHGILLRRASHIQRYNKGDDAQEKESAKGKEVPRERNFLAESCLP